MIGLYWWAESLRKKSEDEERRALEVRIKRACKVCKGRGSISHYGGHSGSYSYSYVGCFYCDNGYLRILYNMRGIQGLKEEAEKAEAAQKPTS